MCVTNLKLLVWQASTVGDEHLPSQQRLYYLGVELQDERACLGDVGIVAQSKVQLWIDPSRPGDRPSAYELLAQQSSEDDKAGKTRRTENGFAGSALLQSSFPPPSATVDLTDAAEDAKGEEEEQQVVRDR